MNNAELIARLQTLPQELEVELEIWDSRTKKRFFGPVIIADEEGTCINLYANHEPE